MNYIKHFIVVMKHKWYVGVECWREGLYLAAFTHDLSKFLPIEFFTSAKYFQGTGSPLAAEKREKGYSVAWLNHKAMNKHHWEYWIDFVGGEIVKCDIPQRYIVEMACDMVGAAKTYGGANYKKGDALKFLYEHWDSFLMEAGSKHRLETKLHQIEHRSVEK